MAKSAKLNLFTNKIEKDNISFDIDKNDKKLGTLIITETGVAWHTAKKQGKWVQLSWNNFLKKMKTGGRLKMPLPDGKDTTETVATPAVTKSVKKVALKATPRATRAATTKASYRQ